MYVKDLYKNKIKFWSSKIKAKEELKMNFTKEFSSGGPAYLSLVTYCVCLEMLSLNIL